MERSGRDLAAGIVDQSIRGSPVVWNSDPGGFIHFYGSADRQHGADGDDESDDHHSADPTAEVDLACVFGCVAVSIAPGRNQQSDVCDSIYGRPNELDNVVHDKRDGAGYDFRGYQCGRRDAVLSRDSGAVVLKTSCFWEKASYCCAEVSLLFRVS